MSEPESPSSSATGRNARRWIPVVAFGLLFLAMEVLGRMEPSEELLSRLPDLGPVSAMVILLVVVGLGIAGWKFAQGPSMRRASLGAAISAASCIGLGLLVLIFAPSLMPGDSGPAIVWIIAATIPAFAAACGVFVSSVTQMAGAGSGDSPFWMGLAVGFGLGAALYIYVGTSLLRALP